MSVKQTTMNKKIEWSWREHPIGFPLNPEDRDFEGPRTSPYSSLCLTYRDGEVHLRHAIMAPGTRKTIPDEVVQDMKRKLTEWLMGKLNAT